jgi:O-antigen/teichoic acid export membrane protein
VDITKSNKMRTHVSNAAFGALDYVAYPAGMLLLAPAILTALGIHRFGVWALANAVLMTGAILASGFGDANIRAVAQARARRNGKELVMTVRSTLGIHLVLGLAVAGAAWMAAPAITQMTVKTHVDLAGDCLWSMRMVAGLILLRALETVCVSTQRAFSRYGAAIEVSVCARIASLLLAWLVPSFDKSVTAVLAATLAANAFALCIQLHQLKRLLGIGRLTPMLDAATMRGLLGFGIFTWLQAASGLLAGQIDRLAAGFALGTSAVGVYTICVQLTQPIYGISAAGLHFIFPLLASDSTGGSNRRIRRSIHGSAAANFAFVALTLSILLLFGKRILRHWVGPSVADAAAAVLPAAVWGSALSALSVTGSYALLAMGRPKAVAILNVVGGLIMTGALPVLIPRFGLAGVAYSRLLPGCAALLVYLPLISLIAKQYANSNSLDRFSKLEEV